MKKDRYYLGYDDTTWIKLECHEIEVHPGVHHGGITFRELGKPKEKWIMTDSVFFDHLKTKRIEKIC